MSGHSRHYSEIGVWERCWVLFWSYIKITSLVIGGGYAIIAAAQEEFVHRRGWLTDDDVLELVAEQLCAADCYWHALDVPGKGLAYCGITLIPPASLPLMCDIIAAVPELADLHRMLIQAWKEDKYVIHYGL